MSTTTTTGAVGPTAAVVAKTAVRGGAVARAGEERPVAETVPPWVFSIA